VVIAFLAAGVVVGCDLAGIELPETFAPKWDSLVSAAGYLGLVLFMSLLGFIFETGRAKAYARLAEALKKLETTNERLTYLNQEKNEFLGIAAHDLKNPLTVIMTSGELLKIVDESQTVHNIADKIVSASERMHHLITNLLDANTIEQGRYASKLERCEVSTLVTQIIEQNLPAAQRKQIEIRRGLSEIYLRTDAAATLQILDNLISNAVKYSPHNSKVIVHLVPEKEHALVLVRDEGPGISEDDQKKLFQKFSRLSARPTGGESSTGLGLSIAKRLALTLGGDIQCHSVIGSGTTFSFRLPLKVVESDRPDSAQSADEVVRERTTYSSHRN
jgi:signal transduction histidine kinase